LIHYVEAIIGVAPMAIYTVVAIHIGKIRS
jgi:hypothetical protein